MKKLFIALNVLALASVCGRAQVAAEGIIKARAHNLANQAASRDYDQTAQPQASQPAAAAAQPVQLTPEQQAFNRFQNDLSQARTNAPVTATLKQRLAEDLSAAAARAANRASAGALSKLNDDLVAALEEKNLTPLQRARLAQEITVILSGKQFPTAQQQAIIGDALTNLQPSGTSGVSATAVRDDLQNIAADMAKSAGH